MKKYFILYLLFGVLSSVFGQKLTPVTISLSTIDTSYYNDYAQISGLVYQFQNRADSNYLELSPDLGSYDMGTISCFPRYRFKTSLKDGTYDVYIDSLLYEVVTYKNNKRQDDAVSYEYEYKDNEVGWSYERDTMQFTPKDCRIKRNTFDVIIFITHYKYKNGVEVNKDKTVYTRKRRLCRLTFNDDGYIPLNILIHRELRKKQRTHRKVNQILL